MLHKLMTGLLAAATIVVLSIHVGRPALAQQAGNKAHQAHHAAHKSSRTPVCDGMCAESLARAYAHGR